LENQFSDIQTMFKGLMKHNAEHTKILAKIKASNAKLHSLLSKKVFDAQQNEQTVPTSSPSQPKAPDQPLHHVEKIQ
jgi:hypothetical protein